MSFTFFKENLPWIAPSAAIVFAASGYFDRGSRNEAAPVVAAVEVNEPVQAAAALVATPVVSQQDQVVSRTDAGINTTLTSPLSSQNQPTFTDTTTPSAAVLGATRGQLGNQQAAPQPTQRVASFESDPAAFFKDAQATLNAANSCRDDLRALTAQARVYFPSGGLTAEDAGLQQARLIGTVMQGCKGVGILVTGHSDPSGDPAVNLRLSQKRAEFVIQRISASGIDTSSFVPQGYGDRQPSTVTGPKAAAYYDRRVEFSVVDLQTNASFNTTTRRASFKASCVTQLEKAVQATKLYYSPRSIAAPASDIDAVMRLAQQAAACPEARLRIIGQHTDEAWANEDFNTGILRAKALMSILVGNGIASGQVIIAAPSRSVGVKGQPQLSKSRVDFDVIQEPS